MQLVTLSNGHWLWLSHFPHLRSVVLIQSSANFMFTLCQLYWKRGREYTVFDMLNDIFKGISKTKVWQMLAPLFIQMSLQKATFCYSVTHQFLWTFLFWTYPLFFFPVSIVCSVRVDVINKFWNNIATLCWYKSTLIGFGEPSLTN